MDQLRISELNPELAALDSKQFKAAVTLIWPYSSSARQFAILFAETDFRLRRKKGQVRARFLGSSAKAIATTGVGIGDEVILSLRGAKFVQEGAVNTPGKSIDWELLYTQTVLIQVFRNGSEIANLELVDVAPTPAPPSPVRRESGAGSSAFKQWSSPAFLKRVRLSDGPIFEAPYDPLADENDEGHDKKRRRKSYRDWKAWTYSARTPSPEKEDAPMEEDFDIAEASPSRPTQLPDTPVSPPRHGMLSVATGPLECPGDEGTKHRTQAGETTVSQGEQTTEQKASRDGTVTRPKQDETVRDADYYELYAGPNEFPPSEAQYTFGGDTEVDTEVNTEEDVSQHEREVASSSTTEAHTEEKDYGQARHIENDITEIESAASDQESTKGDTESAVEADSMVEVVETRQATENMAGIGDEDREDDDVAMAGHLATSGGAPRIVMPPPTLPTLQTDFLGSAASGPLTPIGREPASPTLQPQDSATLPLPSPFPGERDVGMTSYLDHVAISQQAAGSDPVADEEQDPPSEASYIMETSFFSSIGSSKASAFHPNHESSFTPVRFTFGMDGAGFSRPLNLSSPAPEEAHLDITEEEQGDAGASAEFQKDTIVTMDEQTSTRSSKEIPDAERVVGEVEASTEAHSEDITAVSEEPDVIVLSSDSDSEYLEESEAESEMLSTNEEAVLKSHQVKEGDQDQVEKDEDNNTTAETKQLATGHSPHHLSLPEPDDNGPNSTHPSAVGAPIVDLGTPSEDNSDKEEPVAGARLLDFGDDGMEEGDKQRFSRTSTLNPLLDYQQEIASQNEDQLQSADDESHSEFVNLDFAPDISTAVITPVERTPTHATPQQEPRTSFDPFEGGQPLSVHDYTPRVAMGDLDDIMRDAFPFNESSQVPEWEQLDGKDRHPDIKMESIEEDSLFQTGPSDMRVVQEDQPETNSTEQSGDLLIAVPEEGQKFGETHTIAVPATGPAKNTRSKTKISTSPAKERTPGPKRTTRSTRSKASVSSVARTTISPPRTRTRSTTSPSQDATHISPHSLRSQSKLLSPIKSTSVIAASATRSSSRKHASQRSVDSTSDAGPSRLKDRDHDPFMTSFEPSQELGASQGRYSHVTFVKDSEEESIRSENSITTDQYSDDRDGTGMQYTNVNDTIEHTAQNDDFAQLKLPPARASESKTTPGVKTRSKKTDSRVVNQARNSSPSRRLRSAASTEIASPSPRKTRSRVQDFPPEPAEERPEEVTPKAGNVVHPELQGEIEDSRLQTSSPPPPPPTADKLLRNPRSTANGRNRPITPEATQQTTIESQSSFTAAHRGQDSLITPQLTQATSAGVGSFQSDVDVDMDTTAVASTVKSSPIAKSTPRRNVTTSASASASPTLHDPTSDVDSDSVPEQPSIGLSTPLAYYTPLKDLLYFLNRSSQFHSAANPDTLALVTSLTTSSEQAKKGPKHWNTTLHITDASTWPATTTVQIFRAYQTALPHADVGDIILLRAFAVKSLNRHPTLISADESSWCVWRYGKPVWGAKRGAFGEIRAREETKGPTVERGEGEWREVERLRAWFVGKVKAELGEKESSQVKTRSRDKVNDEVDEKEDSGVKTRSKDKGKAVANGDSEI